VRNDGTTWFSATLPPTAFTPGGIAQPNTQVQAFLFGNPNLTPEVADTFTYGVVFNPDWWPVGRLGLSVDRYEIEIDQQIGQRSIAQILNGCITELTAGAVPPFAPGTFCALSSRDAFASVAGSIGSVNQSLANFAGVSEYSGIDVNLRWSMDLEEDLGLPGTFGIASLYSWVDESDGSVGVYVGSIGGIIAEHKAATSFTYDLEDWSFLLRWNYMSGVDDAIFGAEHIDAYNMYDMGGRWSMTDDLEFSFGMDNIFDKQPPLWAGAIAGGGQFNTDGSTYESLGRQYRLGLRWKH
jgi:outer membrane receptor protein involved in Fe transport